MINRRQFLKLLGGTLAVVGTPLGTIRAVFADEAEPERKLLKDAVRELATDYERLMWLLGDTYQATGNLVLVGAGVNYAIRVGANLPTMVRTARRMRKKASIGAFLTALRNCLMDGADRTPIVYTDRYAEMCQLQIESAIVAAFWQGISPEEELDLEKGKGYGDKIMTAYRQMFGNYTIPHEALYPQEFVAKSLANPRE